MIKIEQVQAQQHQERIRKEKKVQCYRRDKEIKFAMKKLFKK